LLASKAAHEMDDLVQYRRAEWTAGGLQRRTAECCSVAILAGVEKPVLSAQAPGVCSFAESAARKSNPFLVRFAWMAVRWPASMQVLLKILSSASLAAASTSAKVKPGVVAHDLRNTTLTP